MTLPALLCIDAAMLLGFGLYVLGYELGRLANRKEVERLRGVVVAQTALMKYAAMARSPKRAGDGRFCK